MLEDPAEDSAAGSGMGGDLRKIGIKANEVGEGCAEKMIFDAPRTVGKGLGSDVVELVGQGAPDALDHRRNAVVDIRHEGRPCDDGAHLHLLGAIGIMMTTRGGDLVIVAANDEVASDSGGSYYGKFND